MLKDMTNGELIAALQKLDPNSVVSIELTSNNKSFPGRGMINFQMKTSADPNSSYFHVNGLATGTMLCLSLPKEYKITAVQKRGGANE